MVPRPLHASWSTRKPTAKKNTVRNDHFFLPKFDVPAKSRFPSRMLGLFEYNLLILKYIFSAPLRDIKGFYETIKFEARFGDRELDSLTTDEMWGFLTQQTHGTSQGTKKLRYSLLSSFFNFGKNILDPNLPNPCDTPVLRKIFGHPKPKQWTILEKDVVDEMIFRTENPRNRLILELMARSGMRIGEVLGLRGEDIEDRRISLTNPKSGKESELVYIPKKVSDRLRQHILQKNLKPDERVFPISYSAARNIVKKAGLLVNVKFTPHDLRRHAATYASRAGTPIEIVSKLILRHANLSTTQRYLGRISEVEAMRWIDNLHG